MMNLYGFLAVAALIGLWALMQWYSKLPGMESLKDLADVINSRGGNILLLAAMSFFFFVQAMRLFYNLFAMIAAKQLTPDNATIAVATAFVTGSAFGGAMGALLKTMNGEGAKNGNGNSNGASATPIAAPQGDVK